MIFEFAGAKLYYETHGDSGPYVLLMHGWGGKCDSWKPVIRDFSESCRLVVMDFPGHGQSSDPPRPWSVTEYAGLIKGLIKHLGIERADLVGHSFGARVAIVLSAGNPELVGRMILTGAAGIRPRSTFKGRVRGGAFRLLRRIVNSGLSRKLLGEARIKNMTEKLVMRFGSSDYRALSPYMRKTFSRVVEQDLEPYLARIAAPTLLVWGELDTETPLWMGKIMEREIPDATLTVFPSCGHFAYLDRYSDFKVLMRRYLLSAEGS